MNHCEKQKIFSGIENDKFSSVMLFYMCDIPISVVELDTVQDTVMKRYQCYTSKDVEYDISTESDVLGHFIMCLTACKSPLLKDIIMRGEVSLFVDKLNKLNEDEIKKQLNRAVIFLISLDQIEGSASKKSMLQQKNILVQNILKIATYKGEHVFGICHKRTCYKYEIIVPFTFPLKLIAKREINIVEGKAKVPCGLWKDLLIAVFELFFEFEIKFFKEFHLLQYAINKAEDNRIRNVIQRVEEKITGVLSLVKEPMSLNDIDKESKYFPPCMLNLHRILRQTHRLSYYSRYQYTLFLKDIGLPADENVEFWKSEYSKPHCSSTCTHNWEEKVSRYQYQILHLYGMNGAAILRTSHSCDKFTEKLSLRTDGGCPFAHFTSDALRDSLLKDCCEVEDIIRETEGGRPQRACALYFLNKNRFLRNQRQIVNEMSSPLLYYNLAKGTALLNEERKCKNLKMFHNCIVPQ